MSEPEKRKQKSRLGMSRRWRINYAITIILALAPIVMGFTDHFRDILYGSLILLGILNFFSIIVLEIRIMKQSSKLIRKSVQDSRVRLGIDTWGFIKNRWLNALRSNQHKIVYLYVLRLSAFIWWSAHEYIKRNEFRSHWYPDAPIAYLGSVQIDVPAMMVALVILSVFFALEMMLITAIPIAVSLRLSTLDTPSQDAIALRIGIPAAFAGCVLTICLPLRLSLASNIKLLTIVDTFFSTLVSVLVDNGLWWSAIITGTTRYGSTPFIYSAFIMAQIVGMGLYLLWTWVMLRLAKSALDQRLGIDKRKPKPKPQ